MLLQCPGNTMNISHHLYSEIPAAAAAAALVAAAAVAVTAAAAAVATAAARVAAAATVGSPSRLTNLKCSFYIYTDKNYKVCSLHINIPLKFGYLYIQKIKHCAIHVLKFELLWRMLLSCGCVKRRARRRRDRERLARVMARRPRPEKLMKVVTYFKVSRL